MVMSNQIWFYNINNLSRYKCTELEMAMTSNRPLLVALQETKLTTTMLQQSESKSQICRRIAGYTALHIPHKRSNINRICGGLSFYIKNKLNYKYHHELSIMNNDDTTQIESIEIKYNNQHILIIMVYIHPSISNVKLCGLLNKLNSIIDSTNLPIIIGGDFNKNILNDSIHEWQAANGLSFINELYDNKPTHRNNQIDLVFTRDTYPTVNNLQVDNVKTENNQVLNCSDHKTVAVFLTHPSRDINEEKWIYDYTLVDWTVYETQVSTLIPNDLTIILNNNALDYKSRIQQALQIMIDCLTSAADEVINRKMVTYYSKHWWKQNDVVNNEGKSVKQIYDDLVHKRHRFKSTPTNHIFFNEYMTAKQAFIDIQSKALSKDWNSKVCEIGQPHLTMNQRWQLFNKLKPSNPHQPTNISDENGSIPQDIIQSLNNSAAHYASISSAHNNYTEDQFIKSRVSYVESLYVHGDAAIEQDFNIK